MEDEELERFKKNELLGRAFLLYNSRKQTKCLIPRPLSPSSAATNSTHHPPNYVSLSMRTPLGDVRMILAQSNHAEIRSLVPLRENSRTRGLCHQGISTGIDGFVVYSGSSVCTFQ